MILLGDVSLPIGYDEGGEWQGYDESDESEQGSPYGEAQKEDGGIEAHGLAHDTWRDDHVDDDLHDAEDEEGQTEDDPEVLPCVSCFHQSEEGRRDEGEGVEVWHEVEDSDEYAQTDGHWEVDDGESDAEEYAHDECNGALSADVAVELMLYVLGQGAPERSVFLWEYAYPVVGEILIVHEDEEHVEQDDERADDADDDAGRLAEDGEELRHGGLEDVGEVVALDVGLYLLLVFLYPVLDVSGDVVGVGLVLHIAGGERSEPVELLEHRRDDEVEHACHDHEEENHGDDDAQGPCRDMQAMLHELDERIEQIGQEPCHEERQQDAAEGFDDEEHGQYACHDECPAYESVECDGLSFRHDVLSLVSSI